MATKRFNQNFIPRGSRTKPGKALVFLCLRIDGTKTQFSLNRNFTADLWNKHSRRLNGRTPEAKSFNAFLDSIEFRVHEIYREMLEDGSELTGKAIKAKLFGIDTEKPRMLLEIFEEHNNQFKELVGKEYAKGTYKRFKVCAKSLREFLQWKFQVDDINIKKLNFEFINDYEFFLKTTRNCAHNTVMGFLKKLKKIVRQCVAKDWLPKDPFMAFKITLRETHRTILTNEELKTLIAKPMFIDRLDLVKDMFLFSCFTGLAYSDILKLKPSDVSTGIDGKKWIFTTRTKTDTQTRLPLLPQALSIIEKYRERPDVLNSGLLLPMMSNQRLNGYLKELADLCGITKELTFHCARHTFATSVTLTNGVPIETVSKMLGHKSIRTTQQYAKILDQKVSDDMEKLFEKLAPVKEEMPLIENDAN